MKKMVIASQTKNGSGIARVEANNVKKHLQNAYDAIEAMSDEGYNKYIPDYLLDDLNTAIREIDASLNPVR